MPRHTAKIHWAQDGPGFIAGRYSREHTWTFDGGLVVPASASPDIVRVPWSNPACVDPEEAFIASVASCHMLWFLSIAGKADLEVLCYDDHAEGEMSTNEKGALWISKITLRPRVQWHEDHIPTDTEVKQLHHEAHEKCFIANSIKTEVCVEPVEMLIVSDVLGTP